MKTLWKATFCLLFFPAGALAQMPPVAGRGPDFDVAVGYSYFNLDLPSSGHVSLNGPTVSITSDFLPRLGVTADLGYARAANVFGSGYHSDVLTYLAGPVFYPARHRRFSAYLHGLFGGARVTAAVPLAGGGFLSGYVNKPSWALGGGVEYRIGASFGFRTGADYVHTVYVNASQSFQGQQNLRVVFSVVYFFPRRRGR